MTHSTPSRNEIDAQALRTFAGNGFGDAAIGRTQPHVLLDSVELYHLAREHRSYKLREIVEAMLQAVGDFARQMVTRWKRQQQARATYLALRGLDSHILRDLGFHRSELMSVAAEVAGQCRFNPRSFAPAVLDASLTPSQESTIMYEATPESTPQARTTQRYAKCIEASKRIRWDIDRDVIRGRKFDFEKKFLPDGLSKVTELTFLQPAEMRFLSQIQGRTYANIFGLVERYIGAKTLEISKDYWFGDQVALEALVRFTDEELKHQELFRRLEQMAAAGMPAGYSFKPQPNDVAGAVLSKSTWAVLGLTLDIELFTQAHYRSSIESDANLSELWKDVFLFHWKEESQHAIMDELEWRREHERLTDSERDQGVMDLIDLVGAVDDIVQMQAEADADYFIACAGRTFAPADEAMIHDVLLKAYRWQYIVSGVQEPRFGEVLKALVTPAQMERIGKALAPILAHVGH